MFEVSDRYNHERSATARVLIKFLEEPFFNTTRTKEQLGYIVRAFPYLYKTPFTPIWHSFLIQSSVKDADYCEHRINAFLEDKLQNWDPTDAEVETIKEALINSFKQKKTNLATECNFNWSEITAGSHGFDSDLQKIEYTSKVTKE